MEEIDVYSLANDLHSKMNSEDCNTKSARRLARATLFQWVNRVKFTSVLQKERLQARIVELFPE